MNAPADLPLTIRPARAEDAAAVRRLAALDSAPVPHGPLLLAEVDGRLLAAAPAPAGRAIADPFAETAVLVDLLRVATASPGRRVRRRTEILGR
ncbi:MAG: hypothetical protein LC720_03105 [Actinobacteria bacterium]|nr:hypothetical protein [Actinomycetota bacterium]